MYVCVWGGGEEALRKVTADSESGLQLRKSVCLEQFFFGNIIRFYLTSFVQLYFSSNFMLVK